MNKSILITILIISLISAMSCGNKEKKSENPKKLLIHTDSSGIKTNLVTPKTNNDSLILDILNQMDSIFYSLKEYNKLKVEDNCLNHRIQYLNKRFKNTDNQNINLIDHSKLDKIFYAKIKGSKQISSRLYPRAEIEIWECGSPRKAEQLSKEIEQLKQQVAWSKISKSPITYWQQGKWIVFITPGGFYMLDEVGIIKDYLSRKMNKLQ